MGRPMRINSRDCDTPEPSATDLLDDFSELPPTLRNKFVPPDFEQLMHQWSAFLRLSKVLGNILSENYCLSGPVPSKNWIEATERELMHCMTLGPHEVGYGQQRNASSASPALAFQRYQLQLHFKYVQPPLSAFGIKKPAFPGTPLVISLATARMQRR